MNEENTARTLRDWAKDLRPETADMVAKMMGESKAIESDNNMDWEWRRLAKKEAKDE